MCQHLYTVYMYDYNIRALIIEVCLLLNLCTNATLCVCRSSNCPWCWFTWSTVSGLNYLSKNQGYSTEMLKTYYMQFTHMHLLCIIIE